MKQTITGYKTNMLMKNMLKTNKSISSQSSGIKLHDIF